MKNEDFVYLHGSVSIQSPWCDYFSTVGFYLNLHASPLPSMSATPPHYRHASHSPIK